MCRSHRLARRQHALVHQLTTELSEGFSLTLCGVLWASFNRAKASTRNLCNRTNVGIQFSCMHVNVLSEKRKKNGPRSQMDPNKLTFACSVNVAKQVICQILEHINMEQSDANQIISHHDLKNGCPLDAHSMQTRQRQNTELLPEWARTHLTIESMQIYNKRWRMMENNHRQIKQYQYLTVVTKTLHGPVLCSFFMWYV